LYSHRKKEIHKSRACITYISGASGGETTARQ
jgi:hypothetical protein